VAPQVFIPSLQDRAFSHLEFICDRGHIVSEPLLDCAMSTFLARSVATVANFVDRSIALTIDLCRGLRSVNLGSYRPEQHYMRGPGPKWHEKHPAADISR
jgi:hypothetical protein